MHFCEQCAAPLPISVDHCPRCAAVIAPAPEASAHSPAPSRPAHQWVLWLGLGCALAGIALAFVQRALIQQMEQPPRVEYRLPARRVQQVHPLIPLPAPQPSQPPTDAADDEAAPAHSVVPLRPLGPDALRDLIAGGSASVSADVSGMEEPARRALAEELGAIRTRTAAQALEAIAQPLLTWRIGTLRTLQSPLLLPPQEGMTHLGIYLPASTAITLRKRERTAQGFRCLIAAGQDEAWVDGWLLLDALRDPGAGQLLLSYAAEQQRRELLAWEPVVRRTGLSHAALEAVVTEGLQRGWIAGTDPPPCCGGREGSP